MAISEENKPVPLAVLISGRGSNLQALIRAWKDNELGGELRLVVSNRVDAGGLEKARDAGLETLVVPHGRYATREAYDRALVDVLNARDIKMVCLAGFMRLLGATFCEAFPMAVVNIHPSLLPAFPGMDAQRQALEHGVKVSGATVHFVTPALDDGPIILQRAVPVRDDDTPETLAKRILAVEHEIYPEAVRRTLCTDWTIDGRRVVFSHPPTSQHPVQP